MCHAKDYNVHCVHCGAVWPAVPKSAQWWRAKKRDDDGYLDALHVSGEECGCIPRQLKPDAPYRVTGFGDMGEAFDVPFSIFTKAVTAYLKAKRTGMLDIWITGVSRPVKARLRKF